MSEKMREEFEAWAVTEKGGLMPGDLRWLEQRNTYFWAITRAMWEAWQASRAALVVELPARVDAKPYACYEGGWNDMHDEAREAIEAAGVRVQP